MNADLKQGEDEPLADNVQGLAQDIATKCESNTEPTADSVIRGIVERTPKDCVVWTAQNTQDSLNRMRQTNGDAWIVANARILESQMLAVAYF